VLDDLGAKAFEMRERMRVRRELAERAEAESAAWLERLAQVAREDDPRWVAAATERKVAKAADDAVRATPFGSNSDAAANAAETIEALQRQILELLQANQELTKGLSALRRELVDLRTRNDALVTQLAVSRLPQQRRVTAEQVEGDDGAHESATQSQTRVEADDVRSAPWWQADRGEAVRSALGVPIVQPEARFS
jgi:hypothetical protein